MALEGIANATTLSDECKVAIVQGLWPRNTTTPLSAQQIQDWDAYFQHYTSECHNALQWSSGEYTTVRKHADVLAIARQIEAGLTKGEIKKKLILLDTQQRDMETKERMAEGSLRLVVRLFTMIDIGPISTNHIQGPTSLSWDDKNMSTFKTVLARYFEKSSVDPEKIKFGEEFTAFNIQRFAGIQIQWTNNLADHLRLIENDSKLCIFHHITFLRQQESSIFPDGFVEETLRTLDLLFPRYNKDTHKWLASQNFTKQDSICVDLGLRSCYRAMSDERLAERFEFWRDELITIKELFDKPRPTSIRQFWYDDRNKVQWYTFWIAFLVLCLTIFFGLVQSVEGALQVYKAYHPTHE